jgi:hypothetical protein
MEPESSLPHSQAFATRPDPGIKKILHIFTIFNLIIETFI